MAGCRDVSLLVSRAMDEALPPMTRLKVRVHLLVCDSCRQFAAQLPLLRAAARRLARQALGTADEGPGSDAGRTPPRAPL